MMAKGVKFLLVLGFAWALVGCTDESASSGAEIQGLAGGANVGVDGIVGDAGTGDDPGGDTASEQTIGADGSDSSDEDASEQSDTAEADGETEGPTSGPCEFWFQDCGGNTNCYPNGAGYECLEPTGSSEEAGPCEEDTDCFLAGMLCSDDGCAIACSIDEFAAGDPPICVDDCTFGFEVLNLDLQVGYCLPDTTPGEWEQIQPETVTKEHVFKGIWMSGPNDIHLVGADGIAVHYQGDYWEVLTESFWPNLNGIWGFAPDDIWAVGIAGTVIHYDGVKWSEPGGCESAVDCDDENECTIDMCEAGKCLYEASQEEGCCGGILFSTGWDSGGLEGWTVLEPAVDPVVGWHVFSHTGADGAPRFTSPFHSLYFGNPTLPCSVPGTICPNFEATGENAGGAVSGEVVSPLITLPITGALAVSFDAWIDTEASFTFDRLELWIIDESGFENLLWEKEVSHNSFQTYSAPITKYGGQEVQFRFNFDSMDSIANQTEGIYIDDFRIENPCEDVAATPMEQNFPTLFDVWGSGPSDIYTVGLNGFVARYDGESWKQVDFSDALGPWGFSGMYGFADSLHFVGSSGLIMKETPQGLIGEDSTSSANLKRIWGNSPSDLYAVGESGTILRYNGTNWASELVPSVSTVNGVWGAGSFEVVAAGDAGLILRKTDLGWVEEESSTALNLRDIWGAGSKASWAVGDSGIIVHFDGTAWLPQVSTTVKPLNSIHGTGSDEIWSVGEGGIILKNDGSGWSDVSSVISHTFNDVWATGDGKAIVVGDLGLIIRGDGETWEEMYHPMGSEPIQTVWARAPDDVYAAGQGFILHYDGNEEKNWSLHASTIELATWRAVCGSGPDHVVIVGAGGTAIQWNGKSWGRLPIEPETEATASEPAVMYTHQFYGCWAEDPEHIWAVGENGLIFEWTDGEMVKAENLVPVSLRDVFAFSKELVFAVGIEGVILASRGIGTTWLPIYSGTVAGLFGILGTTLEDITAVGDLGTIQRFLPFYDALGTDPPTILEEVVEEEEQDGAEEGSP